MKTLSLKETFLSFFFPFFVDKGSDVSEMKDDKICLDFKTSFIRIYAKRNEAENPKYRVMFSWMKSLIVSNIYTLLKDNSLRSGGCIYSKETLFLLSRLDQPTWGKKGSKDSSREAA